MSDDDPKEPPLLSRCDRCGDDDVCKGRVPDIFSCFYAQICERCRHVLVRIENRCID